MMIANLNIFQIYQETEHLLEVSYYIYSPNIVYSYKTKHVHTTPIYVLMLFCGVFMSIDHLHIYDLDSKITCFKGVISLLSGEKGHLSYNVQ